MLLASIRSSDPVIFLEPKTLYRSSVENVPIEDYEVPLGTSMRIREGTDVTLVGWGAQIHVMVSPKFTAQIKGQLGNLVFIE